MERKTAFIYTGGTVFDEYVIEKPEKGDLIIAADAGYLTAKKMGVTPDILLGELNACACLPKKMTPTRSWQFRLPSSAVLGKL